MTRPSANFKAVVFDFDGTLVDSYEAIAASVNHVRSYYRLPPLSTAEVRRHVGHGPVYLLEHTVPGSQIETDLERYRAHHPSVLRSGTRLLEGVRETLPRLREARLRLAICSNKPRLFTQELLQIFQLSGLIDVVIGPEDADHIKPAPDMLLKAISELGMTADEALYVGDMVVDIETARAAGVTVWAIPTGSEERANLIAAKPARLLMNFSQIGELLTQ
jgi:phosphoglycolate phosphatase